MMLLPFEQFQLFYQAKVVIQNLRVECGGKMWVGAWVCLGGWTETERCRRRSESRQHKSSNFDTWNHILQHMHLYHNTQNPFFVPYLFLNHHYPASFPSSTTLHHVHHLLQLPNQNISLRSKVITPLSHQPPKIFNAQQCLEPPSTASVLTQWTLNISGPASALPSGHFSTALASVSFIPTSFGLWVLGY